MKIFLLIIFIHQVISFEDFTRLGKIKQQIDEDNEEESTFFGENYIQTEIKCNKQLLINYGLKGLDNAIIYPHEYCPSIQKNCCSIDDMRNSLQEWDNIIKFNIERWYETYLVSIKYLIGYSDEFLKITDRILSDGDYSKQCISSAQNLKKLKLNNINTIKIYDEIKKGLESFKELRKGFYCVLCDAQSQGQIQDYIGGSNQENSIYLSKQFCEGLVKEMISSSFYVVNFLMKYLEESSKLIKCLKPSEEALTYELEIDTQKTVRNCYNFHHKYFFFFCESYCEKFNIVKQTNLFEGNLVQLQKFVIQYLKNKRKVFESPQNNILCDGVAFEEELLQINFQKFQKEFQGEQPVFFKPSVQGEFLEKFFSDIVYYGGIDMWQIVDSNKYYLILNNFKIALPSLILLILFQIIQIYMIENFIIQITYQQPLNILLINKY